MDVRVERLLGRKVIDRSGEVIGRLEEIHVEAHEGDLIVVEWVLGTGGLIERLSLRPLVEGLLGRLATRAASYRIPGDALDLGDPDRPLLRGRLAELLPMPLRRRA